MSNVFLIFCELGIASEPFQSEGFAGGFVTVILTANNIHGALSKAEAALTEDGYEVVDIDKAMRFDPEDWEHDAAITGLIDQVTADSETRYSEFDVWGH